MKNALILVSDDLSAENPHLLQTIQKLLSNQIQVTVLVMVLNFQTAVKTIENLNKVLLGTQEKLKIVNWFDLVENQSGIDSELKPFTNRSEDAFTKKIFQLANQKTVERYFDHHFLEYEKHYQNSKLRTIKQFNQGKLQYQFSFDEQARNREIVGFLESKPINYTVLNTTDQQLYHCSVKPAQMRTYTVASDSVFANRGRILEEQIEGSKRRNVVQIEVENPQYSVHDYVEWRPYTNIFEFYSEQIRKLVDDSQHTGIFIDLKSNELMSGYLQTFTTFNY